MRSLLFAISCFCLTAVHGELFFTPQMIGSHIKGYSKEEVQLLEKDLKVIRSVCLEGTRNAEKRFYLATAGAPGSRKTTILERFLSTHPEYQEGVYLDPDPRTLKFMVHTYYARSLSPLAIAAFDQYDQAIQAAYEKWRAGSNYIALTLLEEAFGAGRSIVYGTTSTGAHIPQYFAKLKENDYQVILLLCSCPDNVRYEAVEYRNKVTRFYQSSPEDAVAKGHLFLERIGAYFTHADELYFYWSDTLFSPERLGGIWKQGKLEVKDSDAMQRFIDQYEKDRAALEKQGRSLPSFDKLVF